MDMSDKPWVSQNPETGEPEYQFEIAPYGKWQALIDLYMPGWESPPDADDVDWFYERHERRPWAITADKAERLFMALRQGSYPSAALRLAGITQSTYVQWLKRGGSERYPDAVMREHAVDPYLTFSLLVETVEAMVEVHAIGGILSDPDWKAKAWYLERRYKQRWGKPDSRMNVGVAIGAVPGGTGSNVTIMLPDNGRGDALTPHEAAAANEASGALPETINKHDEPYAIDYEEE